MSAKDSMQASPQERINVYLDQSLIVAIDQRTNNRSQWVRDAIKLKLRTENNLRRRVDDLEERVEVLEGRL